MDALGSKPHNFSNVTTIRLANPYDLHPDALNPTMDLVVLHRNLSALETRQRKMAKLQTLPMARRAAAIQAASRPVKFPSLYKGKEREFMESENHDLGSISLGLWRAVEEIQEDANAASAGPSVTPPLWEVSISGNTLKQLCWSLDGEHKHHHLYTTGSQ